MRRFEYSNKAPLSSVSSSRLIFIEATNSVDLLKSHQLHPASTNLSDRYELTDNYSGLKSHPPFLEYGSCAKRYSFRPCCRALLGYLDAKIKVP